MNGISPRPLNLTQHQIKASATVLDAVPELGQVTTDLIAQYASEDYSQAAQALRFDKTGKLLDSAENREITATMKAALISSECDPDIKRSIFLNLGQVDPASPHCKTYNQIVNSILHEIRVAGSQINLNYVDFTFVNMRNLDLSRASIVAAKFINSHLVSVQMQHADLSGTLFKNMQLLKVNLSDAVMSKAILHRTNFKEVDMSGAIMGSASYYKAHFKFVTANRMISDDSRLQKAIRGSVYDPRKTVPDLNLNEFLQQLLKKYPLAPPTSVVILNGVYESNGDCTLYTVR